MNKSLGPEVAGQCDRDLSCVCTSGFNSQPCTFCWKGLGIRTKCSSSQPQFPHETTVIRRSSQEMRTENCRQGVLTRMWALNNSVGKEFACNAGDPGSIPGSGSPPGEGIGYPLQYSWASLVTQVVKNLLAMWEI